MRSEWITEKGRKKKEKRERGILQLVQVLWVETLLEMIGDADW